MEATTVTDTRKTTGRVTLASGALPFIFGSTILGTIGIFVHEAHAHYLTATWFRCAFGLLGLTGWLLFRKQMKSLLLPPSSWPWVLAAGVSMVLGWGLFFAAIERTSAGVATVLFHVQPLWLLLIAVWLLRESIARRRIASVMVAMVGLVLATGMLNDFSQPLGAPGKAFGPDYWLGVALCLVGAFCTACVTLIAKRLGALPAGILAWWQCAIGTLFLLMWPMTHGWPAWGVTWMWLSGLGLIHTGLAYSLMYIGMARLSTDRIAIFQFIYPAIAIIIDWLFYGYRLEALQMAGVGIMAVAISFSERVQVQQ